MENGRGQMTNYQWKIDATLPPLVSFQERKEPLGTALDFLVGRVLCLREFSEMRSRFSWFLVLGSLCLVPGSWFLVPGSWFLVLGSWFLVLGSLCLVPGSWFLVLGSLFLVLGSWFLVPERRTKNYEQRTMNKERLTGF
jgi:hypothetical protein